MGKTLVTGASGHIGCHVVRSLLDEGREVVALVRPTSDRRGLAGLDVEVRQGDVLDRESLKPALQGVESVAHVAAVHRNFAPTEDELLRPAVEGTRNVLDACVEAGVSRVVLTSSGATIGFADDPSRPLDETHHVPPPRAAYIRAKVEQEKLALADSRLEVVVLNPSGVFGPLDFKRTPATRSFIALLQGDPSFLTLGITDVRDVGRAHALAMKLGKPGERYLIVGDTLSPKEVAKTFERVVGFGPKVMTPPRLIVTLLAWLAERKARASGGDAPITRAMIDDVWGKSLAYDASKSKRELGMSYRPAEDVVRDTVRFLLDDGAYEPKVAARIRTALRTI